MKYLNFLALLIFLNFAFQKSTGQVNVQGNIEFSTTWTKALSPYIVTGDVQVPSGVTLTIEPGVVVKYTGSYEMLIKGKLIANGAEGDTIVFCSDVAGTRKGKRFLNFEATDLTTHQMSYIKIADGTIGIQIGDETEHSQGNKNTGRLKLSHFSIKNTDILTSGYETGAELLLYKGVFGNGQIKGDYPRSEKVSLNNVKVTNATLFSDSYNNGIWLDSCQVSSTSWIIGCCGANFNINHSRVEGGSFTQTNTYYDITINNSLIINLPMNLGGASNVNLSNSIIYGGSNHTLICNNLTTNGVSIRGAGTGIGLDLSGTNNIQQSTISGMNVGVKLNSNSNLNISNSNICNNQTYNIENSSVNNISASQNWWGTIDEAEIGKMLWDKNDDLNKGGISFTDYLTSPKITAPVVPPLDVVKVTNEGNVDLKWKPNSESDFSGYRIYFQSSDGIHFGQMLDVGNVTSYTLTGAAVSDNIAVTAYDTDTDGQNDQTEGHESWYSKAGNPEARIGLSPSVLNMGVVQVNSTVSKKVVITNKGTGNLLISNITASTLFSVDKTNFTIKPDSCKELTVSFTPTSLGMFSGTINISHNSSGNNSTISVSGMGATETGTGICGIIPKDSILRKSNSPYYVLCDVQVPSGVTLTIEPGVVVKYTGSYEMLIKGKLIANGAQGDTIVFCSDVAGTRKGKRFLNFEATDLTTHQMSYIKIADGTIGIQIGDETEHSQGNKNTGRLKLSHFSIKNTDILTSGYETGAELLLYKGVFGNGQIKGDYPRSEKVSLNNVKVTNATLFSDSYNNGIWLDSCQVSSTSWIIGCCGANFNINHSRVEGGSFVVTNDYYDIKINNSSVHYLPMDLSSANSVLISNSNLFVGYNHMLKCNNLNMSNVSVKGKGVLTGVNVFGNSSILSCSMDSLSNGVVVEAKANLNIQGCSFKDISNYNILNSSVNNISATKNWWGTLDVAVINNKIKDKKDDLNYGEVIYSPLYMTQDGGENYLAVVNNSISPIMGKAPLEVVFNSSAMDPDGATSLYQWDFNGDKKYDYSSKLNGDTIFTYTQGGNFTVESKITDDKNLSNRLFHKISVIGFEAKSKVSDVDKILVNWGWGNYQTIVIDASALNFLSDGDTIHVVDQNGNLSSDCKNSETYGSISVGSQIYSSKNDSFYVFNCQPHLNNCGYNSKIISGYLTGNPISFKVVNSNTSFSIKPTQIKSGNLVFTDSAVTWISLFQKNSFKSGSLNEKPLQKISEQTINGAYSYNVYRNQKLYREGLTSLYMVDQKLTSNTEYCYDVYLVDKGVQMLSKSTCAKTGLSALDINPSICMVTVNDKGKNVVVWQKEQTIPVDSFYVYQEVQGQSNQYKIIARQAYNDAGTYIDTVSDVAKMSNKYKIALKDVNGKVSNPSLPHKTVHLTVDKDGSNRILKWEHYTGNTETQFKIYRGTNVSDLTAIGTTSGNDTSFVDSAVPIGEYYYQVEAVLSQTCPGLSAQFSSSRSNLVVSTIISGISNSEKPTSIIYPNPARKEVYFKNLEVGNIIIYIYDINSKLVLNEQIKDRKIDVSQIPKGVYFIKVISDDKVYFQKLIIE